MAEWKEGEAFPPGLRHTPVDLGTYEVQSVEWLDLRRGGIGASDSPSILGAPGAFSTSLGVWAQKIDYDSSETVDERRDELFHFGNKMEPLIASELMERTGYEVRQEPRTLAHPDNVFIHANLDGWVCVDGVWGPAEFKNVGAYVADQWLEEVPLKYQVQIQHQMYVTGADVAVAAALIGGNQFLWSTLERNEEFIDAMVNKLKRFWVMVDENIMPTVGEADLEMLKQLADTEVDACEVLPFEAVEWAAMIAQAKAEIKNLTEIRRETEAKVWAALGNAAIGELPNNSGQFIVSINKHGTKSLRYKETK